MGYGDTHMVPYQEAFLLPEQNIPVRIQRLKRQSVICFPTEAVSVGRMLEGSRCLVRGSIQAPSTRDLYLHNFK